MASFSFALPCAEAPTESAECSDVMVTDNRIVQLLGCDFFASGSIPLAALPRVIESIRVAFEDGGESDTTLIEACEYGNFALTTFLLKLASSDRVESVPAACCLAFAGNVNGDLWSDYTSSAPAHLCLVLTACKAIPVAVRKLHSLNAPIKRHGSYLGYDPRDKADYNIQGYDEEEERYQAEVALKADREDAMMVLLLLLSQFFLKRHEAINVCIQNNRDLGVPAAHEEAAELVDELVGDPALLDSHIVPILLYLVRHVLSLAALVFEDASYQCVKVAVGINAQFPLLSATQRTTEVAREFIRVDCWSASEGMLTKLLLYLLNENGYPNMCPDEGLASVKLCAHLLNDHDAYKMLASETAAAAAETEGAGSHYAEVQGHFYTNDVKVLVEVCLRELANIPADEHARLRMGYLELLDGILTNSTWATSAELYLRDNIQAAVVAASELEDGSSLRDFALDMLERHSAALR